MELYKDKEIIESKILTIDPDNGIEIEENIDLKELYNKKGIIKKAKILKRPKEEFKSDFKELEEAFNHPYEEKIDLIALKEIPQDYEERLIDLDELIEYLDNSEEQIDV